jgi:predicted nicotinamide N-methyase
MSSSDVARPAEALARAAEVLAAGASDPDCIPDVELRTLIANVIRLYAAKAESGMRTPLPARGGGVTVTETMLTVTDLLHAVNVQLFELSMWQAMSGNCIAPHQRVDAP